MFNNIFVKILKIIEIDKWKLAIIVLFFVVASIVDVVGIGLMGPYISLISDNLILENEWVIKFSVLFNIPLKFSSLFFIISIGLLVVFLLKFFLAIAIQWIIYRFGYKQLLSLRVRLMKSYQLVDYLTYLDKNSSDYIYTVEQLSSLFVGKVLVTGLKLLSDLIISIAIVILLAWVNIYLLISLVLVMIVAIALYDKMINKKMKRYGQQVNASSIDMMRGVKEGLEGFKEVRVLSKESYFFDIVRESAHVISKNLTYLGVLGTIPRFFIEFLMVAFIVSTAMVYAYTSEDITTILPTLAIFGISAIRLIPAFNSLTSGLVQIRFNEDTINRLYEELTRIKPYSSIVSHLESNRSPKEFDNITITDLYFHYPNLENISVLNGVNMSIKRGEFIGITGTSGSGKSTLIDILLGFLAPGSGEVIYNNHPLETVVEEWRSKVSYLPQKVLLIDGSVKDNIALGIGNEYINEEKIKLSLEFAQLDKLVTQMPKGINTLLGEDGSKISGGQRQRIALARAFYHDREVLIMDETTSALDKSTERDLVASIRLMKGAVTIIIVSHSEHLLNICDHVYHLDQGKVLRNN